MRRRTGGSLLRTATSELTPLTAARLSALQQRRLPDVDEDRPGAWANQVVARSPSLYIHARRACDARTVCASTSMVPSAGDGRGASLGTPPAFDGGHAPFVLSMAGASLSLASAAPRHRRGAQAAPEHAAVAAACGWQTGRLLPASATLRKKGSPALALAHYPCPCSCARA